VPNTQSRVDRICISVDREGNQAIADNGMGISCDALEEVPGLGKGSTFTVRLPVIEALTAT